MIQYTLCALIIPVFAHASFPQKQNEKRYRYTTEQLKQIKPPLVAQQFDQKPKTGSPKSWRPPMLQEPESVQSPSPLRRKIRKYSPIHTPHSSVDMTYVSAAAKPVLEHKDAYQTRLNKIKQIPFPEIVITFEELK